MLTERGHIAQEVRGAGGDGREGRAGRRSPDQDSDYSYMPENEKEALENQNLLMLLYKIAQEQATREAYVHRGVTCNNCQTVPIRGIRYRCVNCLDYDLCEDCEADVTTHNKTHLFLKIRIPAPFMGTPRPVEVPSYPGQPQLMPPEIPPEALKELADLTSYEQAEIEALYEQFKVLAGTEYQDKRFGVNAAITRDTFDRCFLPSSHIAPATPNLIHDRMFAFYDSNNDGYISFDEFALGVSLTAYKYRYPNRLQKIFAGYDLDGDGYVDRKDFQRMFKAYYILTRDVIRDISASQCEEDYDARHMELAIKGRTPISAAFFSNIPDIGRGHQKVSHPDPEFPEQDDTDASAVLSRSSDRLSPPEDGYLTREEDSVLNEHEFERRARFWAFRPEDYDTHETLDVLEGDPITALQFPAEERNVGSEILFQMSMKGINELLDLLFKDKEDAAIDLREYRQRQQVEGVEERPSNSDTDSSNSDSDRSPSSSSTISPTTAIPRRLERIHDEIVERGGEGRLDFREFETIMENPTNRQRLEFIGSWTDLATF
ncbi:EF-hand [Ascodesmis nigricans]|uniref:EF-hand n=1 Tax=Ascodesmis nigricans TaxID=341454 RepID=A0A4S2MT04_9PEZI|nr:EF-hand [Ascodesmis nigricans]